jgi:hypothetical protein
MLHEKISTPCAKTGEVQFENSEKNGLEIYTRRNLLMFITLRSLSSNSGREVIAKSCPALNVFAMVLVRPVIQYYANAREGAQRAVVFGFRAKVEF